MKCASYCVDRASKRDLQARQWNQEGRQLTPHAKQLWEAERAKAGDYLVQRSQATLYFVSLPGSSRYRRVDVDKPSCSCATFDQVRIPCRHIMAVVQTLKETQYSSPSYCVRAFDESYLVVTFTRAFEGKGVELPVLQMLLPDGRVKPSPFYKQAGRRMTRRIASRGEASSSRTYQCRVCHGANHIARACRRHANDADEPNALLVPFRC